MEVSGNIIQIGDVYNSTDGTFTKQEIVIEFINNDYANVAVLEAIQHDVEKLAAFKLGDEVKAEFYLSGRNKPWTDKNGKERYFNVLKIKSIVLIGEAPQQDQPQYEAPVQQGVPVEMPVMGSVDESDLPF